MTSFSSLGARRLALLIVVFVIGVACAKVDRGYDDEDSFGGASAGGADNAGGAPMGGGKTNPGTGGKPAHAGAANEAGAGGVPSEAGSAGEPSAGAAGAPSGTLTIAFGGDGTGKVTSDVAGIDCSAACGADFDADTTVVLTATPTANSVFTGWSGGGCSGTGTCKVVIADGTEVKATFAAKLKLSVALAGNGSGVVKSVPDGIDCGATCSTLVAPGASVQLSAAPAAGSVFAGWSGGGCTGTGGCTTTVAAATQVTATFAQSTQTLKVVKAGTGIGTVTSTPVGINCGTACSQIVNYGTVVTLNAVTDMGSVFSGWSGGGCSGTGACVVTMAAETQVTATFACSTNTVNLAYTGTITSFSIPSCVTSLTIDAYGAQGGNAGTFTGGSGARIKGTFAVTGGTTLKVLVGGKGQDSVDTSQQEAGSGGGGTFVTLSNNSPLAVAGGGGGASLAAPAANGVGGAISTAGTLGGPGGEPAGVNGLGGTSSSWQGWHGGSGGAGLLGNGVNLTAGISANYGSPNQPGTAFVNGGAGGIAGNCGSPAISGCNPGARNGGFGGGGAAGFTGGGGGGYSGGGAGGGANNSGGGTAMWAGGGGGSYILSTATTQTLVAATRLGNGMVIFTY